MLQFLVQRNILKLVPFSVNLSLNVFDSLEILEILILLLAMFCIYLFSMKTFYFIHFQAEIGLFIKGISILMERQRESFEILNQYGFLVVL